MTLQSVNHSVLIRRALLSQQGCIFRTHTRREERRGKRVVMVELESHGPLHQIEQSVERISRVGQNHLRHRQKRHNEKTFHPCKVQFVTVLRYMWRYSKERGRTKETNSGPLAPLPARCGVRISGSFALRWPSHHILNLLLLTYPHGQDFIGFICCDSLYLKKRLSNKSSIFPGSAKL